MKSLRRFFLLLLCPTGLLAQILSTALPFVSYPRGATSFGLAHQGAAIPGGLSGMQYNPATLFSLQEPIVETGKLDEFITPVIYPLSWYRAGMHVEGVGVFGLEFAYHDLGEFSMTNIDPTVLETFHGYEWALALSYATNLNENIAVGGTVRNAHSHLSPFGTAQESGPGSANALLFSAGILWHTRDLDDRFTAGLSLTDFGAPVYYVDPRQGDPAPASMRLGVSVAPVATRDQRLTFAFEGSRQVADWNDDFSAKSSFVSLFSSFKRWPHDITGHAAALYEFPYLPLAHSVGISGQIAVGVFDEPSAYGFNYLTSSFKLGLCFYDFQLAFGTASVWNHIRPNYSPLIDWGRTIPEEALGLSLSYRPFGSDQADPPDEGTTTLLAGVGLSTPTGRFKDQAAGNGPAFVLEYARQTSDETAIVMSLGYQSNAFAGILKNFQLDGSWKTWRASMAYRYQPAGLFIPLYVQAGPIFSRLSYSFTPRSGISLVPSYQYSSGFAVGAGIPVTVGPVLLVPCIDFVSMLLGQALGPAPRLSGYNQWIFGIKSGVRI